MLQIERGTASGPGGGRGEFLITLAQHWDDSQLARFSSFCMAHMHGDIPPWFGLAMGAINTIAAYKTEAKQDDSVRPIGVMHEVYNDPEICLDVEYSETKTHKGDFFTKMLGPNLFTPALQRIGMT